MEGISIIICCYNSASRLPETIRYLALQRVQGIDWEIVVVDNNSTDDTQSIAMQEWEKYERSIPFKIVFEPQAGLIHAREKGMQAASYDFFLFCDDDNRLQEDYIQHAYNTMLAQPAVAILGGRGIARCETKAPWWFERFAANYATGEPLPATGIASRRKYIAGAGMTVRREALEKLYELGFTSLLTGRKGKKLLCGEDSEWCLVLLFLGYELYYNSDMVFEHFIPAKRLEWRYCVQMVSQSYGALQVYYDLYRYAYDAMRQNEQLYFETAYSASLKKHWDYLRININSPVKMLRTLRYYFLNKTGSMKEIQIKAGVSRVQYLLLSKKKLKKEFAAIAVFMKRAKKQLYNKALE